MRELEGGSRCEHAEPMCTVCAARWSKPTPHPRHDDASRAQANKWVKAHIHLCYATDGKFCFDCQEMEKDLLTVAAQAAQRENEAIAALVEAEDTCAIFGEQHMCEDGPCARAVAAMIRARHAATQETPRREEA